MLRSPPRIANEAINAGITIAYYNAAGIPDLNGNPWSRRRRTSSTRPRSPTAACSPGRVCLQRQFDIFVTPHNSGYSYSLTDPTNLGTRTYSQLDTFVHQGGGWTALCHSILSNENCIADLTLNGSAAVKSLFKTSLPGGKPGGFLTRPVPHDRQHAAAPGRCDPAAGDLPVAQVVPTTVAQALPGGSVQTWPAPGAGAPTYWPTPSASAYFDTPPESTTTTSSPAPTTTARASGS